MCIRDSGETVELNRPINEDANVELYKFEDEQGRDFGWPDPDFSAPALRFRLAG